jgi:uncharacterized membrane protein YgdD (TMEM256/DUF423 family)
MNILLESLTWQKWLLCTGALLACIAVVIGSFGSHYFKGKLDDYSLQVYEVGVKYQFYHSLGILFIALTSIFFTSLLVKLSAILMIIGVTIFSGSLYTLAITGVKTWGAITPIGGLFFIISWVIFVIGVLRS